MINKRLVRLLSDGKKYIYGNIFFQWINLIANIVAIFLISGFISDTYYGNVTDAKLVRLIVILAIAVLTRVICNVASSKMSYLSSKKVKQVLRHKIMEKMLTLGSSYNEKVRTSEVVQVSVEGVEQIETYFGLYLPQLFYSLLAPLTLFAVIVFMSFTPAIVLLLCVPLIPISIAAVQTFAKKLLAKYWGRYTGLGDTFLENLQGLTTLKIYQADEYKNKKMNEEAEEFRKITMKVLTMQLNSITIMDIVAYGGAALGIILTVKQFVAGNIRLDQAIAIILLSADFFIPIRQLGSFFHIAMNGMAAIDKIFKILDLEVPEEKTMSLPGKGSIKVENLSFSYDESHNVLNDISIELLEQGMVSLVGASGSGKSTMASLLMKRSKNYSGKIFVGEVDFNEISEKSVMDNITYISHSSYIFKGTVRDNLLMAKADARDEELWDVLKKTNLADFFEADNGLDFEIAEAGGNLSGGQKQRTAIARMLIGKSPIMVFDDSLSAVDAETDAKIRKGLMEKGKNSTVIIISHRITTLMAADNILVLDKGRLVESGTHDELIKNTGIYRKIYDIQSVALNYEE